MAFYDWNGNGKKDFADDFIEYHIYKESTSNNKHVSHSSGNGISNFGAILSVIGGLVLQAIFYMIFGIEVENVPVFVIIVLWVVFSILCAAVIEKIQR